MVSNKQQISLYIPWKLYVVTIPHLLFNVTLIVYYLFQVFLAGFVCGIVYHKCGFPKSLYC